MRDQDERCSQECANAARGGAFERHISTQGDPSASPPPSHGWDPVQCHRHQQIVSALRRTIADLCGPRMVADRSPPGALVTPRRPPRLPRPRAWREACRRHDRYPLSVRSGPDPRARHWSIVKTSRAARRRATNGQFEASEWHESHARREDGQGVAPAAASDGTVPRLRDARPDRHRSVSGLRQRDVDISGSPSLRETWHMKDSSGAVQLPSGDESIPPVTILDAQGHVVRVVTAAEFRRIHPRVAASGYPAAAVRRQRRRDGRTS